jgi:cupin fold WbuC family metalloprotein
MLMPSVFHNAEDILAVGEDWVARLEQEAKQAEKRRARLCMHMSGEDSIQEMVIAFCEDAFVRPHRSLNKTESLLVVKGALELIVFGDDGSVLERMAMGPFGSGRPYIVRLSASPWYTYIPKSEILVIHETTRGPFNPDDTVFPQWAPEEDGDLRCFIEALGSGEH